MSMPRIPEEPFRPGKEQVVIDLLKSIAMEETSLAHLLNAEAEKVQVIVKRTGDLEISAATLCKVSNQIAKLLDMIVMKEWLLLRKMEYAMLFHESDWSCEANEEE